MTTIPRNGEPAFLHAAYLGVVSPHGGHLRLFEEVAAKFLLVVVYPTSSFFALWIKIIDSPRRFHAPGVALESPCSMNEFSFTEQGPFLFNEWIVDKDSPMQPQEQGNSWLIHLFRVCFAYTTFCGTARVHIHICIALLPAIHQYRHHVTIAGEYIASLTYNLTFCRPRSWEIIRLVASIRVSVYLRCPVWTDW